MTTIALTQRMATEQGRLFEQSCELALQYAGFRIDDVRVTFRKIGVEVDIVATNLMDISFFFTCKGSMRGSRPGARRTDTMKKAICDAFLLSQEGWTPVVLLTSHIPEHGSGRAMLNSISRDVLFDVLNPWLHGERLRWLAHADENTVRSDMQYSLSELCTSSWPLIRREPQKLSTPRFHFPQLELFSQQAA